jgi:hypothetical protein
VVPYNLTLNFPKQLFYVTLELSKTKNRKHELEVFMGIRDMFNSLIQLNLTYILIEFVQVRVQTESTCSYPKWFGSGNEFIILNS